MGSFNMSVEEALFITTTNESLEETTLIEAFTDNQTQVMPSSDDNNARFYFWLARWVIFISLIFLPSVGSLSNLMAFLVCLRKNLRSQSWAIYLLALSVADTFSLAALAACQRTHHISHCMFSLIYSETVASWVVVAIAVDRLIITYFPFKAAVYSTQKRALIVSVFLYCLIFCLVSPTLTGLIGPPTGKC